jgi:RHS repeat-associated protein
MIICNQFTVAHKTVKPLGKGYANARYYAGGGEPEMSPVFISTDPMWAKYPSLSSYNYCGNNPLKFIDPTGMEGEDDDPPSSQNNLNNVCQLSDWFNNNQNNQASTNASQNVIALDAGHGIDGSNNPTMDPGAVGNGYLALAITQSVNSHLQSNGQITTMIRDGELIIEGNSLKYRTDKAKEDGANIFVSIHINASSTENANGFSVLYKDNPSAYVIDEYSLTNNNCTTVVSDVLNNSGSSALKGTTLQQTSTFGTWTTVPVTNRFVLPASMQNYLIKTSKPGSTVYRTK